MEDFKSFSKALDYISEEDFESKALELFHFQSRANEIYKSYLNARKIEVNAVKSLEQIPFLPIKFFKDFAVVSGSTHDYKDFYSSSGTTGMITSRHYIWSEEWYLNHAKRIFESVYGSLQDFHVLALLPAYLERPGSSLVSMAAHFIKESNSLDSGFYLYNQDELIAKLENLGKDGKKILLLGVTFALLDLAESGKTFNSPQNLIVMETGGMKGRRKEMIREDLHEILCSRFKVSQITSEYGMTELFSQAYSLKNGYYQCPWSMKILIRDVYDPFRLEDVGRIGIIKVIDLANIDSCAFLETQDLGRMNNEGNFEVLGRVDNSDSRGCNLLV